MAYSEKIKNSIEQFFKETNWLYEFREQYGYFQTLVPLKTKAEAKKIAEKRCQKPFGLQKSKTKVR